MKLNIIHVNSQENAALCDQVSQTQENLVVVKGERLFLLRKLCQQQGEVDPSSVLPRSQINNNSSSVNADGVKPKKNSKKRISTDVSGIYCEHISNPLHQYVM